jgi:hypothetical protein
MSDFRGPALHGGMWECCPIVLRYVLATIFCVLFLSACGESRFEKPFYITTHTDISVVDGPGRYQLTASCKSDEQMLGGGYYMPGTYGSSMAIAATASYPSAADSWTVIFEVADVSAANMLAGNPLIGSVYCLTTQDYPIGAVVVSNTISPPASAEEISVDVSCPANSVLTGGGFRTGVSGEDFALHNADLFASSPTMATDGTASGWQVAAYYFPQDNPRPTTAYAVCATQNLVAGPLVVDDFDFTTLPYAWGPGSPSAECPRGMFTTAGGYGLIGDMWIPRQTSSSVSRSQFLIWQNEVIFGYQTTNYPDFRPCDPSVNPNCATTSAFAACVEIPDIPFVSVKILQPTHDDSFGGVGPDNTSTAPITFVAEGFDEEGDPLTGTSLQWTINGLPIGSGESITTAIPTTPDSVSHVWVRVTATGDSTSTYDQIRLMLGTIE